jgi:FixJ family two-component response regulator
MPTASTSERPCFSVVDPDHATRLAVHRLVETMNLECRLFASGREFLESGAAERVGCAILEVRIPDINGLQIQDSLNTLRAPLAAVFLTGHATVSIAVRAMRNGAVHFLEKPFREHELWDTIQLALAVARQRRAALRQRELRERRLAVLTDKERSVLERMAHGRSNLAIARELDVCVRTVELRRRQLMKKLGLKSVVELVRFAATVNGKSASGPAGAEMHAHRLELL